MTIRLEPETLAPKTLGASGGGTTTVQKRLFNAGFALGDENDRPVPYLVEQLPQLNTPSWQVLPDGGMETTYHLRPGLTWHDGTPLSSEDFVFAWGVYATPDYVTARTAPLNRVAEITAPDSQTVLFRWRQPFPEAANLRAADFQPLPRHLLAEAFERAPAEFPNHAFWTREYVGLGPYRLASWEPGAFIEAAAFSGHALGRPKIERLKLLFVADQNAVLANLLGGAADMAVDSSIRLEQMEPLQRVPGWNVLTFFGTNLRHTMIQRRPEYINPRALADVQVRKALAYANDRAAVAEAVSGKFAKLADTPVLPSMEYFDQVDRAITKYPYDIRRSEQLMTDAGYTKGPDGFYMSPAEGKLTPELLVSTSTQSEREMAIMASGWRQVGFDVQEKVLPAALVSDNEARSTFRSMSNGGGGTLANLTTARISTPQTRWNGGNRGGWSDLEFDRVSDAFETTLNPSERAQQMVQMAKIVSDDLAIFSLFWDVQPIPYPVALRGPKPFAEDISWNIHQWEWTP
jgi:peptide/nickel transport system substrate-binding protein